MKRVLRGMLLILCATIMIVSAGCAPKPKVEREDVVINEEAEQWGGFTNLNEGEEPEEEGLLQAGPLTNYLLYGYNVLSKGYIDSKSIDKSNPIIDRSKLSASDYESVTNTTSTSDYLFSSTAKDFYSSLKIASESKYSGVFFSGSIKTDYSIETSLNEQQTLIKYIQYHQIGEQYYNIGVRELKKRLSQAFLDDVADYAVSNPKIIFDTYGTHLIKQYYLGGRAELNFLYRNTSQETKESLEVNVEAAYKSFSGKVDAETEKKAKKVTSNSRTYFKSKGGDNLEGTTPSEITGKYSAWVKSINDKPAISGIADFDTAMLPIWELVDDKTAAKSLKDAFETMAKTAQNTLARMDPVPLYISEINVYADPDYKKARSMIPKGFVAVMLNPGTDSTEVLDANKGAGGDYIYIAYKLTSNPKDAITDLKLAVGDNAKATVAGYEKLKVDLNKNAGGKFIYLCYKKASSASDPLLKEIRGVYTSDVHSYTLLSNWQWVSKETDLNKGAGGKFIYLAMRKEGADPAPAPTEAATDTPTAAPTAAPTEATETPTAKPLETPVATPEPAPAETPTAAPTEVPTEAPQSTDTPQ